MEHFERSIQNAVLQDLKKKMVLLSGPRQVGKTVFAQNLSRQFQYLNFDSLDDRAILLARSWDRVQPLIIFDEIHKMKNWKSWLKGIYDKEKEKNKFLVTGSARLDLAKKVGDSLAGRFYAHRLHPLDIKELRNSMAPEEALSALLRFSGFPEPFFSQSEDTYRRWRLTHLDIILRQDLISLESVRDISGIETLVMLMQSSAGKQIAYANLAQDLERDPKTVKSWLQLLENLFVMFKVIPFSKNITKSLLKEPKFYFYDLGRVTSGEGEKLENLVALALKKELDRVQDQTGRKGNLYYLQNKERKEIDFLVLIEGLKPLMVEVKTSDSARSKGFSYFYGFFKNVRGVQLVKNLSQDQERTFDDGVEIRALAPWLASMDLSNNNK